MSQIHVIIHELVTVPDPTNGSGRKMSFQVNNKNMSNIRWDERRKRKKTHSEGSDKEACGDMYPNLLPLSVGLTLIHWSHDHELLARSRPGALWSICRTVLLIVGVSGVYSGPMIAAPDKTHVCLPSALLLLQPLLSAVSVSVTVTVLPLSICSASIPLSVELLIEFLFSSDTVSKVGGGWQSARSDTEKHDKALGYLSEWHNNNSLNTQRQVHQTVWSSRRGIVGLNSHQPYQNGDFTFFFFCQYWT